MAQFIELERQLADLDAEIDGQDQIRMLLARKKELQRQWRALNTEAERLVTEKAAVQASMRRDLLANSRALAQIYADEGAFHGAALSAEGSLPHAALLKLIGDYQPRA